MPDLPEVREKFVADTTGYSRPLREAAQDADKFSRQNDQAALAARRMGLAAKEAADKAARAMSDAGAAAEKLAMGEISADEAAQAEAKALREVERAAIKAAEAELAAGKAADSAAKNMKQMGRDASLAAAAIHLAALKEVGDTKSYNEALTRLKKTHGDLKGTALEGFKEIENKGSSAYQALTAAGEAAAKAGPIWVVPIANAVMNLPAIASVAGDGIVLGLGAGLSAVGLMAQAKTADIKRTFASLKQDAGKNLTEISAPFHDTLLHIAADARNAFEQLSPALQGAFAEMAPAVTRFSNIVISSLSGPRVQSAITSIGHSFSAVLDELGPATAGAVGDIADGIRSIGDAAAQNPQALASMVTGIGQITKYTLEGVGALMRYKTQFDAVMHAVVGMGPTGLIKFVSTLKDGTQALLGQSHGLQTAEQTFPSFSQQATAAAAATGHLMTAQQAAALSSGQLKSALTSLTSATQGAFDAETQYRQSLVAANAQARNNNAGINGMGKAALANRQALSSLAGAIKNVENSGHHSAAEIENMRQKFIAAARGMGVSRSAAIALADKLLGIKAPPPIKLSMNDAEFMSKLHNAQGLKIDPKTGLLKGNNSDYLNKWLTAKGLKIDPKTGLFKGNNADYYNKWIKANGLKINPKTGVIKGNTAPFWAAVHSIPPTVGYRKIGVYYVPLNSANEPGKTRADGGIDRYADGGVRRDLNPFIATRPTVLFGETETGGEAYIPLGQSKRARSTELLEQVADMFGLAVVQPLADGMIEKYAKGKVKPPTAAQKKAATNRVTLARARPEYLAAMAAQKSLEAMRASVYGGFFRGGPSTLGSAHGSVVEHTTNITLNVQGSIHSSQDIVKLVQRALITNRMPVSLPAGR